MPEDIKTEAEEKEVEEGEAEESPDTDELIKKDISELAAILSENPGVAQQVREVIEYHLKESVDRTTFGKVYGGLQILLGEGAARITANSCRFNGNKFFDLIKKEGEGVTLDKALSFLQHLTALYGNKIEEAHDLSGEIPENWRSGAVNLYRKEEEKVWVIEMDLTKYNRERVFLRMPPASAFSLVRALIREMGKLPEKTVDEKVIKKFREETEGFRKKFLGDNGDRD
jgi:hypothetical protein